MADRLITVHENHNIYDKFKEAGISTDKYCRQLKVISAKTSNNKVGYAQFKSEEGWIKVIVLPKTIENSKDFIGYFQEYNRLLNRYDDFNSKFELNSASDYRTFLKKASEIENEEQLIVEKYLHALTNIMHYFKSHKLSRIEYEEFVSQEIKYLPDIRRNIVSIDKSQIQQKKPSKKPWSEQAEIAYGAIKLFLKTKREFLDENNKLRQIALKASRVIKSAYPDNDGHSFNPSNIAKMRKSKVFKKKKDRQLFTDICVLVGEDLISDGKQKSKYIKLDDTVAIFWEPNKMYEIYVFDQAIECLRGNKIDFKAVYQDDSKSYSIYQRAEIPIVKKSIPDIFIAYSIESHEEKSIVIDAKWKILETPDDISYSDIAKLERDCILRNSKTGVLIYPKTFDDKKNDASEWFMESGKDSIFEFSVLEVNFNINDSEPLLPLNNLAGFIKKIIQN